MRSKHLLFVGLLALVVGITQAAPLGTLFTYQGRLEFNGQPASGSYQMTFWLYANFGGGTPIASNIVATVPVNDGLFTRTVDFGANPATGRSWFEGDEAWLAITVAPIGSTAFSLLQPRTRISPTPQALYAVHAGTANTVTNGAIQAPQLGAGTPANGQVLGYNNGSLVWQTAGVSSSPWLLNSGNTYFNGGNVGIGTSTPTVPLHVNSSATASSVLEALLQPNLASGGFNQIYLGRTPTDNGSATFTYSYNSGTPANSLLSLGLYNSSFSLNVRGNGNVGIGTTTPTEKLHVAGNALFSGDVRVGHSMTIAGGSDNRNNNGEFVVEDYVPLQGPFGIPPRFIVKQNANVGIGTEDPLVKLHVRGPSARLRLETIVNNDWTVTEYQTDGRVWHTGVGGSAVQNGINRKYYIGDFTAGEVRMVVDTAGNVGIGTTAPQAKLDVQGTTRTSVLEITGGADLAEPFPMKEEEIEKGSVVVIDDEHPGRLQRSTRAYDTRVAGIVSGANGINPGISLKQEGALDQGENVALTGRVYVKADASFGAIKPGDLLTTSDTPGHAMKVGDHTKSQGAILGKAMSALKDGTGLVLVLVTLQ